MYLDLEDITCIEDVEDLFEELEHNASFGIYSDEEYIELYEEINELFTLFE
jgi:hypothetical protein